MLTNNDLQAIQQVVKKVVKQAVKQVVKKEIITETRPIKKELQKMRKDLNIVISTFDNDIIETKLRVDRIESTLNLPPFVSSST